MKLKILFWSICLFYSASLFLSSVAEAQYFENLGSVSSALGGAGAGSLDPSDAAFNNPASYALFDQRAASISFAGSNPRIGFADNGAEALFPALFGYSSVKNEIFKNESFYFGVAQRVVSRLSIGVNFAFQKLKLNSDNQKYSQNAIDVGLIYKRTDDLVFGLVLKNKPLNNTKLIDTIDNRPTWALGLDYGFQDLLRLKLEVETGDSPQGQRRNVYKSGLEVPIQDWIRLRIGQQNNNILSQNYFTAGIGFQGPVFSLHYAYLKASQDDRKLNPAAEKQTQHSIDLAFPF